MKPFAIMEFRKRGDDINMMERTEKELYMRAYMDGYTAALEKAAREAEKPYIDMEGLIERYGGRIGQNKAREILQAVRHCCNGGKLNSCSLVLRSELEYWESVVDKQFLARL